VRLQTKEATAIKQAVQNIFGKGSKVFLFGSRVDDTKKGGDIDLYIETTAHKDLFKKKIALLQKLYEQLDEQKIDVVINDFTRSLYIHEVAREEGFLL
jgi:predicted nucleotidyltransferase